MVAGVTSLLFAVSVFGPEDGWKDGHTILAAGAGILLSVVFLFWEKKAREPIIPLSLFKNHTFSLTSGLGAVIGAGMFGAIVMIPLYMQVVKGYGATEAGLKLIPLMLGIVSTSIFSGKAISKSGKYKKFPIAGTAIMSFGILAMATLKADTPYWQVAIFAVTVGVGLGLSMQTIVIALQNAVDFKDMGIATSSNTFFRSLGSVFGTAFFGAVLTNRLNHYVEAGFADLANKNPEALASFDTGKLAEITSNTTLIANLPPQVQSTIIDSFVNAFHVVFLVAAPVTLIGFFLALFLRESPLRSNADYRTARQESAGEALG